MSPDFQPPAAPGVGGQEAVSPARRLGPLIGLIGAVLLMVLSLSAFVVGSSPADVSGTFIGARAPDFSARSAENHRVTLSDYAGRHALLLFADAGFIDRWSPSPEVARLAGEINVLAFTDSSQDVQSDQGITILDDRDRLVASRFDVDRSPEPTAVLVGPEGLILDRGNPLQVLSRLLDKTPQAGSLLN